MFENLGVGQSWFRVSVYNREVRERVKQGRVHPLIDENWADARVCVVRASNAEEAVAKVESRYPKAHGFVTGIAGLTGRKA